MMELTEQMKNKLIDLNNHLFAQLERLSDENISGDNLKQEIERSRAVANISKSITDNARLAIEAEMFLCDYGKNPSLPKMIGS